MKKLWFILIGFTVMAACSPKSAPAPKPLPAAAGSDPKALAVADAVMKAMGGQQAWDETHYISWNFFGRRTLKWDKPSGMCRIEWANRPWKIILNLHDGTGQVSLGGVAQSHPDTLSKYLDIGKQVWINDSYWLVMPFKLKDPGVTLKYLGEVQTEAGTEADLIQMTFSGVGVTPDNKYHVWVDKVSHLVTQWAYFEKYTDEKPTLVNPWGDYQRYGKIMLSSSRGSRGSMAPIEVLEQAPAGVFERI